MRYERRNAYRPPHQHATPRPITPEQREAIADLLAHLADDVRSAAATSAGVSVQPARRIDRTGPMSPQEPGAIVYVGVTVDSPAVDAARDITRPAPVPTPDGEGQ